MPKPRKCSGETTCSPRLGTLEGIQAAAKVRLIEICGAQNSVCGVWDLWGHSLLAAIPGSFNGSNIAK